MNFEELKSKWDWLPIRNCPGRYVWRGDDKNMSPADVAGEAILFKQFETNNAADQVIVGCFGDGGLISYRKADGTYLHTLNTAEGFERKLAQLGIEL